MAESHRFGMFAKYWEPGKVKTRLAAGIGDERAAAVYKAFLQLQISRFSVLDRSQIVFSPDNQKSQFDDLLRAHSASWELQAQGDGDLGSRMARFFQQSFDAGFNKATLIGSDTPTLPLSFVQQVEPLLNIHDVVLGPTCDGGYYLVAAKRCVPPIFEDIAWSTENVWQQTIGKLQDHRVRFAVLPTWYDVDNVDDLQRLRNELATAVADLSQNEPLLKFQQQLNTILDIESH